ncbi:MAG: sigma-E processing peptidase SpoIIGA [Clostridia bacterium]|nr:sigma-E processing peptidase SpoIIGA [Clostridia bacterium]
MTIYADQMFLENFIMNFLILYMTAVFSRIEYKWCRVALSSAVGALYVIFSYVFYFYDFQRILWKILLSVVLVVIAFRLKHIKVFVRTLLCFYAITFFIGGVSFGLSFMFNIYTVQANGIIYVSDFPVVLVAGAVLLSMMLIRYLMMFWKNRANMEQFIYPIEVFIAGHQFKVNAFFDSGNSVTEPLSDYPVIFLEKSVFEKILPTNVMEEIERKTYFIEDNTWKRRFRLIPISTVNNEKSIMAGFKSDKAIVYLPEEEKKLEHAILVYCEGRLSKNGEYVALIGRKTL